MTILTTMMSMAAMMNILTMMAIFLNMMTISNMMSIVFVRKLECVYKQVGGYLTKCARIAASIALNDESLVTQSVTHEGRYRAARAAKNCCSR